MVARIDFKRVKNGRKDKHRDRGNTDSTKS